MASLPTAVVKEGVSKVFSYLSTKIDDKASREETIARLEIALSRLDIALDKTGRIPITYISLLRSRKVLKRVYIEGMDLLNKYVAEKMGQVVISSSSYLQRIADSAATFFMSSLVGLGKEKLSSSAAQIFEMYADWAEKFVAEVESGCPLRRDTSRYPFLRHLFEGKTLRYKMENKLSQSVDFKLQPVIVEGRGIEVNLVYAYGYRRMLEKYFFVVMRLRISEDTDIIGITIKCMQWLSSQFKLGVESAIGELTLLPNLQDSFHSCVPPPSVMEDTYITVSKGARPDPICCIENSYGTLGNKSSIEIPEPVIFIYFSCYISTPKNSLRNAPLAHIGAFLPHYPSNYGTGVIRIEYGSKKETRNGGSVQQLEEIARSDALNYLVHEEEPTDYDLFWYSPHGAAFVTLRQSIRRVTKRKR